jgi:hypothetical protein
MNLTVSKFISWKYILDNQKDDTGTLQGTAKRAQNYKRE